MDGNRRLKKWLTSFESQTDEQLPGVPVVEIAGSNRVLVERHQGVLAYSDESIEIRQCYGVLSISGEDLQLREMTKEQLVIFGKIHNLEIRRRCSG